MVKSSHEREEKRQKRNRTILGILIIVIMVGSTAGYFASDFSNNGELEYKSKDGKKYSFVQSNGRIYTSINEQSIGFYSHPLDALELNISEEASYLIKNSKVFYLTFDPEIRDVQYIEQARFDLEKDFVPLKKYFVVGVTKNITSYSNFEVITCENSTYYTPVISFVYANGTETKGYVKDSCIIFEGKREDFLRFRDYIVYSLYGVI